VHYSFFSLSSGPGLFGLAESGELASAGKKKKAAAQTQPDSAYWHLHRVPVKPAARYFLDS